MAAAATAARMDALEATIQQMQQQLQQSQLDRNDLAHVNQQLKISLEEVQSIVELQSSSVEADRGRNLVPSGLPAKVILKVQCSADVFPLIRECHSLLKREVPDVERALLKLGQIYRLHNNILAGADLAKQHPASERAFEFIEHYYDLTKAAAMRAPAEADWRPEAELVKHNDARKAAVKLVEADIAKSVKAYSAAGFKRPAGRAFQPQQNYQQQQRPSFNAGGSGNTQHQHPSPPSGGGAPAARGGAPGVGNHFGSGGARIGGGR